MRAMASDAFGEISAVKLCEVPKPSPGPGDLLIQVRAAAVNPADLKVLGHREGGGFLHASSFPLILGYDFSGTVAEVGSGVTGHSVGEEVFGFLPYASSTRGGTYAEFVSVGAGTVGPKPKNISHEEAAASATSVLTAVQALAKAGVTAGQEVLVNGASGGVGSYAVQVAKIIGARVTATASAPKLDYVKGLGADRAIDYKATPLGQITERFEMVFDVASTSSFGVCGPLLKPGGTYLALLPRPGLFLGVAQSWFSSKRCTFVVVKPVGADFERVSGWFAEGKLRPILDQSYPLAELHTALERQKAGDFRGKLAITVSV